MYSSYELHLVAVELKGVGQQEAQVLLRKFNLVFGQFPHCVVPSSEEIPVGLSLRAANGIVTFAKVLASAPLQYISTSADAICSALWTDFVAITRDPISLLLVNAIGMKNIIHLGGDDSCKISSDSRGTIDGSPAINLSAAGSLNSKHYSSIVDAALTL